MGGILENEALPVQLQDAFSLLCDRQLMFEQGIILKAPSYCACFLSMVPQNAFYGYHVLN